jgi:hypothetical protein
LQWKTFQWGDIVANLFGSSLFLYAAHLLHLRSRKRQELSSLYQPLSAQNSATYRDAQGRQHAFNGGQPTPEQLRNGRHARSGSNVWEADSEAGNSGDERNHTIFGLGDEDDDDQPEREARPGAPQLV